MNAWKRVRQVIGAVVGIVVRRRKLAVAVIVALLLVVPLALTGDGEVFVLNAVGIGIAALILRRLVGFRKGRRHGGR